MRTSGKSSNFADATRKAIHDVDSFQPIEETEYVENYIARNMARPKSLAALISSFALLGYALVLLGVYGTVAHATNGRLREYGIRLAMGAEPYKLWLRATLSSLSPLLAGIVVGAFLAWNAGRLLQSEIQGVNPGDPIALILFSIALLVTALATGAFASRCILRVDPMTVLRNE
jgi:ABC-type antimicrobial peptide transport system permease subunit